MTPWCPREVDVAAAASGRWPESARAELRVHVDRCASCREVASVVAAASATGTATAVDAHLPSAAEVWWRLAVRARLEREQAAARPVVWLQGLAGACGVGLVLTAAGRGWPATEHALVVARGVLEQLAPGVPRAVQPATEPLMLLVLAASGALAVATLVAAAFVCLADD